MVAAQRPHRTRRNARTRSNARSSRRTGLSCDILRRIDTIKYSTYIAKWEDPPTRVFKVVTFYLSRFTGGDMGKHDQEVDRVEWFPVDDAIHRATYPQEREILRKAETLIRKEG